MRTEKKRNYWLVTAFVISTFFVFPLRAQVIKGKFTLPTKQLLFIGQDISSIKSYIKNSGGQVPAGLSGYTSIQNLEGITTTASYGSGPHNLSILAKRYPNSALLVGVYLVNQLERINNGVYDYNIDLLIDKLVALKRPIYLRWGYEFDGPHHHYNPTKFIQTWKRMYRHIQKKNAQGSIAMVWHSWGSCAKNYNNHPLNAWYPGDKYVDLIGISVFTPQDCNWAGQDKVLSFARKRSTPKPVIICEATPQGYDLSDNTSAPIYGDKKGQKVKISATAIWNNWFRAYFNYINKNKDVIRIVSYINADWNSQSLWSGSSPYYWGDSRIHSPSHKNKVVFTNWNNAIKRAGLITASNKLFQTIGYRSNKPISNTIVCSQPHGVSYIDDQTVRVYHKKGNNREIQQAYICVGENCYVPKEKNGYYYFDFNKETTYSFVNMKLWHKYTYKFKFNHAGGFYTTGNIPFTFTKKHCTFITSRKKRHNTHISDVNTHLKVFPNPVTSMLHVKTKVPYTIYNSTGRIIYQGNATKLNVSQFRRGLYILNSSLGQVQFIKK